MDIEKKNQKAMKITKKYHDDVSCEIVLYKIIKVYVKSGLIDEKRKM